MKTKNMKNISLALASAAVCAAIGGITLNNNVTASAAVQEKNLSEIFYASSAVIAPKTIQESGADVKVTAFDFSDEGSVSVKRDLALKWFDVTGAKKYFTTTFAFQTLDFISASVVMETPSAWATEKGVAENVVKFTKEESKYYVTVNGENKTEITSWLTANTPITLALGEGDNDGEMNVSLNGAVYGQFTNVGANYADYEYDKTDSLKFTLNLKEDGDNTDKTATLLIYDINGQSFKDLTVDDETTTDVDEGNKVKDTAAPVVVVNEELYGFALGTQFNLDYIVLDVFQDGNLSKELTFYQYNPNVASTDTEKYEKFATLNTTTYFYDTVYNVGTTNAPVYNTVYNVEGAEYVAIKLTAWDSTFNEAEGDYKKAVYDIAWYANQDRVIAPNETTAKGTALSTTLSYIPVDKSNEGPKYNEKYVKTIGEETVRGDNNLTQEAFENQQEVKDFYAALEKQLAGVYAGTSSESYVNIPSLKWFFNNSNTYGYRNMKFNISYRKPNADSESSATSLSYNGVKFLAEKEGKYEFKVFATNTEGGAMEYYHNGKLVELTVENVWDIDAIPYFHFEIKDKGLKVKEPTATKGTRDTKVLNEKYTMSSLTVLGANNLKQDAKLYKIDLASYNRTNPNVELKEDHLIGVTYERIAEKVAAWASVAGNDLATTDDIFAVYLNAYAEVLAERVGGGATAAGLKGVFVPISEAGDRLNGKKEDDKYEWDASSKPFKTVEEGHFLVLVDYSETINPAQRAAAYKVVLVQSKKATITGESQWWKDNLVSVILFAISGVLLIIVIILLFVKPSEETLEDLDEKAEEKAAKKQPKDEE